MRGEGGEVRGERIDSALRTLDKNRENPFDLVEPSSLMLHLHDLPLEQTQSQIIQTQHQSRWDFNQTKRKTRKTGYAIASINCNAMISATITHSTVQSVDEIVF